MNDWSKYPNLLKEGCPWVDWRQTWGLPNVKWCEETLCSWVAEPANTWSNLAFFVSAIVITYLARKESSRTLRFFGPVCWIVGLSSLVYHSSVTFVMQVFDFFGMYFFFLIAILLNTVRMGWLAKERVFASLWVGVTALTIFTVIIFKMGLPIQGIVFIMILVIIATEAASWRKDESKVSRLWFAAALSTTAVAAVLSGWDASGQGCDPTNHVIQGHALWHAFNGVALCLVFLHYRQLRTVFV